MAFTKMDLGTADDWAVAQEAVARWQARMPQRIKSVLVELEKQNEGFAVNQFQHSLQTATRVVRSGSSEELVVAALCHDIGTAISIENHAAIAAEILLPYVSRDVYQIIRTHQDFQRNHYHEIVGENSAARRRYERERWFETAVRFSDEWDQVSFAPSYDTLSLEYFEPMIDRVFRQPKWEQEMDQTGVVRGGWSKITRWLSRCA